jgi:transcriptional regulator of arginine metabolism
MEKERRQRAILELIERENFSSQERLRQRLVKAGFDVTQATLSRDFKELNVIKSVTEEGLYKYTVVDSWMGLPIRRCEVSGNLLVFRTEPGMAAAVAYRIDELELPGVIGTVAGEDTLLAVIAEDHDPRKVRKQLWTKVQQT